jgi:hypothetical protein
MRNKVEQGAVNCKQSHLQEAGIADHVWMLEEIIGLIA